MQDLEIVSHKVDENYYTFRAGSTTHLIGKSLPQSFIKIDSSEIFTTPEGLVRNAKVSEAKQFPKMELRTTPTDNPTLTVKTVIYGDSIMGLLALPMAKTETGFSLVAAFNEKSGKWLSPEDQVLLYEFQNKTVKDETVTDETVTTIYDGMNLPQLKQVISDNGLELPELATLVTLKAFAKEQIG